MCCGWTANTTANRSCTENNIELDRIAQEKIVRGRAIPIYFSCTANDDDDPSLIHDQLLFSCYSDASSVDVGNVT